MAELDHTRELSMHQRHLDSARTILESDPAGALRLAIDTIRWSIDWTIRATRYIDADWLPKVDEVGPIIDLAQSLDDYLERIVAYEQDDISENDEERDDTMLLAVAAIRALTSTGELVDLDDVVAELGIGLDAPDEGKQAR